MPEITAKVIPDPSPDTGYIIAEQKLPVVKGFGDIDVKCGSCGSLLVSKGLPWQIQNVVFKCPNCQNFNAFELP